MGGTIKIIDIGIMGGSEGERERGQNKNLKR